MTAANHKALVKFSKELVHSETLINGLNYISESSKKMMKSERCSIFIVDKMNNELWTTLADGIDKIVIPSDIGMIGYSLRTQKVMIENEPYDNPNFLADIDIQTGYYTQNLISAPIFSSEHKIIGILQLLNKESDFTKEDGEFITFFSHYISGFIELHLLD